MKLHLRRAAMALFIVASGVSSVANAVLVDRGGGLIYDTDLNITWLSNANVNGLMNWDDAMAWASNFSYYDSVRNVTYTDWRLPTTTDTGTPGCNFSYNGTDCGFNSTGSEMSHLFYTELGNKGYHDTAGAGPQEGWGLVNKGPFTNFQSDFQSNFDYYWSGSEYAPDTLNFNAWLFAFNYGSQNYGPKAYSLYAFAVRPGDVAAVPVPAAAWLFGSGLLGLLGVARARRKKA